MANTVKVGITAEDQGFKQSLSQMAASASQFAREIGASGKGVQSLNGSFRTAKKAVMDLSLAYSQLSDEAKNSDFGRELVAQIEQAKKAAAELQDLRGDISEQIKNMSSDTSSWDAMKEGIGAVGSAGTALIGIMSSLGGESETAAQTLKLMATAQATVNAVITVGNALQKQSALMTGISVIQTKAAAAAKALEAKATVGATAAQRVFNAVAKANPYVLLATAILAVGTALVGFATNAAEAKKKEEELQKETERLEAANESYGESVSSNSAEMIMKITALSEAIKKEGKSQEEKNQIYEAAKPILEAVGIKVNDYNDVENALKNNTPKIVESLLKRAEAMAYYYQAIERTKDAIKSFEAQRNNIAESAKLVGTVKDIEDWKKLNVPKEYLTRQQGEKVTRYNARTGEAIEYNAASNNYMLTSEGYARWQADQQKKQDALLEKVRKQNAEDFKKAMENEDAYKAIMGSLSTGTKTPKRTSRKSSGGGTEKPQTQVEKLNKALEEQAKKLQNINKENDKDGTKRKEIYATMLKINQQLEQYYDVDDKGFEQLKKILKEELTLVENNSEEWDEINEKIKEANIERIGQLGNTPDDLKEMLKLLEENRNMVDQGTEEWNNYTTMINKTREALSKLDSTHIEGSLGFIQDMISELEDIRLNVNLNTEEGQKQLVELTKQIAALTGEEQIISIMFDTFSFDNFSHKYDSLFKKFEGNVEITPVIKKQMLSDASDEINTQLEALGSGIIDFNTFKSRWDEITSYIESKGIDTSQLKQAVLTGITSATQDALSTFGNDNDVKAFVDSLKTVKSNMLSIGATSREVFDVMYNEGMNAFNNLQQQYDSGLINADTFRDKCKELAEILKQELGIEVEITPTINEPAWKKHVDGAADALSSLSDAMGSIASATEDEGLQVAAIITKAIANVALGASAAIANAGKSGNPWVWIGFAAAATAEMAAMIASIHSATGMAEGGIVQGSTTMGDRIVTRLNAGEMVLNRKQQSNLFNALDNGISESRNDGPSVSTVKIKGDDIYLSMHNYYKRTKKSPFE